MFTHKAISALNELELTVYNYIVKNGDKVMYMTIRELADAAGCLLYTSPSPRDRTRSRMPSSA